MQTSLAVLLVCSVLSFLSCSFAKKSAGDFSDTARKRFNYNASGDISYETKSYFKSVDGCREGEENCTYISINYDVLASGDFKEQINSAINDSLKHMLYYTEGPGPATVEASMDLFITNRLESKREFPETAGLEWYYELTGKESYRTERVMSYYFSANMFTGGAHPNYYTEYYNFDLFEGKTLTLNDIFSYGFEPKLQQMVETQFRKDNSLKPGDDLTTAGLFDNSITYNENFAFTKEGFMFFYNTYEISPYARGTIEVVIPYSEIKNIMRNPDLIKEAR